MCSLVVFISTSPIRVNPTFSGDVVRLNHAAPLEPSTRGDYDKGMRFLIEFDGPIVDVASIYFKTYHAVAGEIGWSRLDQATYWRLLRTKGKQADILPAAKPQKREQFQALFDQRIEADEVVSQLSARAGAVEAIRSIVRHGPCKAITLGTNADARRAILEKAKLVPTISELQSISQDVRRRPSELKVLAENDKRAIIVTSSDTLGRAAREAEIFVVGLSCGTCSPARLHQAGVDVVFSEWAELQSSLATGAKELIQAGLLPASLG